MYIGTKKVKKEALKPKSFDENIKSMKKYNAPLAKSLKEIREKIRKGYKDKNEN